MAVAFPDLPKGGSLDDVHDAGAAIQQILDAMNANPPAQQPSKENCAEPANPATPGDLEDPPAETTLRKVEDRRAALTYDQLVTPDLGDSLALLTKVWPAEPVTLW